MITIIVLYADDIRIAFLDKSWDFLVDCLLLASMLIFLVEMLIQSYCLTDYLGSFFFWLDLISLMSMPLDVYFVM